MTVLATTAAVMAALLLAMASTAAATIPVDDLLKFAVQQTNTTLGRVPSSQWPSLTAPPKTAHLDDDAKYIWQTSSGWTSGFFPGQLWLLANYTDNADLFDKAAAFTAGRAVEENNTGTHDVGFMTFYSFGKGIEMQKNPPSSYKDVLLRTAHSLAERYSPVVGMTRSWGSIDDEKQFEVIIDNLMNLELLFWSSINGNNKTWMDMAVSHVDNTAKYWIRPDGSTFHLVVFNPQNGSVISRSGTPQGLAVNSTWARGQAWGIYGFTMAYRYTKLDRFLDYAKNVTEYWLANVPADLVPIWDFDAPSDSFRDTSGAAIVASALIELHQYTKDDRYLAFAESTLQSLSQSPYLANATQTEAILTHDGHDCSHDQCTIIEADYYFVEAILRWKQVKGL